MGLKFFRDQKYHMLDQFKWSDPDEDAKYFKLDKDEIEAIERKEEIKRLKTLGTDASKGGDSEKKPIIIQSKTYTGYN